jgi:CDP-paratose 2-epimerase
VIFGWNDFELLPDVDWVIDTAANASVLAGVDGKTSSRQLVQHNLQGTLNLLEYCRSRRPAIAEHSRVFSIHELIPFQ